jgi:uncharacterized protein
MGWVAGGFLIRRCLLFHNAAEVDETVGDNAEVIKMAVDLHRTGFHSICIPVLSLGGMATVMDCSVDVKKASIPVRADGSVRIAAVSDTHSHPHPATMTRLAEIAPDAIFHAGDIGDLAVLGELARIAPVYAVRGNIDTRARDVPDALVLDVASAAPVRILLTHIAVYGPKLRAPVVRMAKAEGAALVVCGHSHVPFIGRDHGIAMFNPGSIGPRRFTLPIVFGTIDITPSGVRLAHVDVETGARWLPP